ncbi:MAG: hypothetical protein SGCHY_003321 [Lobulomycetales sp.]
MLFLAPMRDVLNQISWTLYGLLIIDNFVLWNNVVGLLLGLFYTLSLWKYTNPEQERIMKLAIFLGLSVLFTAAGLSFIILPEAFNLGTANANLALGIHCVVLQVSFFGSPVLELAKVLRTKDSSAFHAPFVMAAVVNCVGWATYGIVLRDYFLLIPNVLSLALSLVQLACKIIYPSNVHKKEAVALDVGEMNDSKLDC